MNSKQIICCLLSFLLLFSIVSPASVFAEEFFTEEFIEDSYEIYPEEAFSFVEYEEPIYEEYESNFEEELFDYEEEQFDEIYDDGLFIEDNQDVNDFFEDEYQLEESVQQETVVEAFELSDSEAFLENVITLAITKQPEDASNAIGEA